MLTVLEDSLRQLSLTSFLTPTASPNGSGGKTISPWPAHSIVATPEAVQKLVEGGAAMNDAGPDDFPGDLPITIGAAKGDTAIVEVLLEADANPNACCCDCVTELHRAIEQGHSDIVARLLEGGADPRIRNNGVSTRELANRSGNPEIVRRIEEALAGPPRAK